MSRRHTLREGDWTSVFERLLELVTAASGDDPFEEIFNLVVARLYAEQTGANAEIAPALDQLLAGAATRWPGLLYEARTRLPAEQLAACSRVLAPLSLSGAEGEGLDAAFEVLVNRSVKGEKGQFFTPRHVIEACVRAVAPRVGETVLDPACGSGGFLLHALRFGQRSGALRGLALRGYDIDRRACRVAAFLLRAAGAGDSQIRCRDSLAASSERPDAKVDIVLTNPPFAGELQDRSLLQSYEVARPGRRVERDALFLEQSVRAVRPGGRLAIVLPHNKLGSEHWSYLRQWLLEQVRVVAVLGLGRHTFLPHTHQKACVVFARRRLKPATPSMNEPILMAINERDGKDSRGRPLPRPGTSAWGPAWERLDHDLNNFVERFQTFIQTQRIPWAG